LGTNGQLLGSLSVDQPVTSLAFSADADTLYAGAGDHNSAHLIEWSAYRHHGIDAGQTDPESMLALVSGAEQTVSQPSADLDAVALLQRASQLAQARGYALGYPLFATLPNGNQQCVGVRNVLNREIWVPLTDFLPEAPRPQATYASSEDLIKGMSESASVWAQERGFTCAVPTLFGRHDADGIPSYGLTLLWGPGLTPKRVRVTEQAASVAAIVRRVHGEAVSQGFVSGIPTFLMRDGRVQCILLAADVAELFEVPASELADR
jgi:hypothetical protein